MRLHADVFRARIALRPDVSRPNVCDQMSGFGDRGHYRYRRQVTEILRDGFHHGSNLI